MRPATVSRSWKCQNESARRGVQDVLGRSLQRNRWRRTCPHRQRQMLVATTAHPRNFCIAAHGLRWSAEMRAMPGCLHDYQLAARDVAMQPFPDRYRRNDIVAALQYERRGSQLHGVGPVIRHERDPAEVLGDLRIGAAEAVGQLLGQLGLVAPGSRPSCSRDGR